ncbi:MAG: hypothetical protein ACPLWB_06795 [Caldisericia bacterium]
MEKWESILIDKNLPNPIPPSSYSDLESRFSFVDREDDIKDLLNHIDRISIDKKGILIFLLADQGRGKTTFLKYIAKNYSYPNKKILFSFMNFPMDMDDLDFCYLFQRYVSSVFHSGAINEIYEKLFLKNKNILGEKPKNFDEIIKISKSIKTNFIKYPDIIKNYPNIIRTILYSLSPSPYTYYIYRYIEGDELEIDDENLNFLKVNKNEHAITRMLLLSNFLKANLGIEHTIFIIDDFDILDRKEEIFRKLYKLLIYFRNNSSLIENFSIILSGSTTFYDDFINFLSYNEKQRIESWIYTINLPHLKSKDFLNIINNCFTNYWKCYLEDSPFPENIFGIFSSSAIEFLYDYKDKDLRNTLRKLHDLIDEIRKNGKLEFYTDINRVIKEFKHDKIGLKEIELNYFEDILEKRIKEEKSSTFINKSLENIFSSLKEYYKLKNIFIEVESERKINENYADVFLKVDNLNSSSFELIFEVKMLDKQVPYKEILSRLEMIKDDNLKFLYWITKSELEKIIYGDDIKFRIINYKPLNKIQFSYLSYLIFLSENSLLNEISDQDKITLLKQAGIDMDIILNPPIKKPPIEIQVEEENIDILIEKILNEYIKNEKTRIKKDTLVNKIKEKERFKDLSRDFLISKIVEISMKLDLKATQDFINFKTKELK